MGTGTGMTSRRLEMARAWCVLAFAVAGAACSGSPSATDAGAQRDAGTQRDAQATSDAEDAPTDILLVAPTSDASADRAVDARADVATADASDAGPSDASSADAAPADASSADVAPADALASDAATVDDSNADSSTDAGAADGLQHLAPPTYLGTVGVQGVYRSPTVAIAPDGSIFYGGSFDVAQDFDPGPSVDMHTPQGMYDAFLTKLNADGSYAWTLTFGGSQALTWIAGVAVSQTAIVVAGGDEGQVDLDPGAGIHEGPASAISGTAGFVVSLTRAGAFNWASPFAGPGACDSSVVALGADGSIYAGGSYQETCDFDPGPGVDQRTSNDHLNGYLLKLAGDDGHSLWTQTYTGAPCDGYVNGITVASDGDVWVTGAINASCSFGGLPSPAAAPEASTLIASFAPNGSADDLLTIAGSFGGGIAAAPDGSIYVGGAAGGIQVLDLDPGPGVTDVNVDWPPNVDDSTGFVVKLGADRLFRWAVTAPRFPTFALAATEDGGVLALAQASPDSSQTDSFSVTKLTATGAAAWTLALPTVNASAFAIAARGSTFTFVGTTSDAFDVDPGAAMQVLPQGMTFVSRYSF